MYLTTNTTGHNHHEKAVNGRGVGKKNGLGNGVNHFLPSSPLFKKEQMPLIYMSDAGLLTLLAILSAVIYQVGFLNFFVYYGAPYLWVNNWLGELFLSKAPRLLC